MNLKSLLTWRQDKKQRLILEALAVQLRDPKSEVSKRVESKAGILAGVWVMTWLDKKGIRHCAMCPSTDTLRREGEKFLCPLHFIPRGAEVKNG